MANTDIINRGLLAAFHDELRKGLKDGSVEVSTAAALAAVEEALNEGLITPAQAQNLQNWAERDDLAIEDVFTDQVRTAAGDQSINSEAGAQLVSIRPVTDFRATALVTTGFNLLRAATQVGSAWYFLVPALPFGTYGTAEQPNGVLFTDSQGNALTPTVRFRPLSEGVPTSASQGDACAYTDSHGLRFYTTTEPGYLIVSGINRATTCAHLGWSRRYTEYIDVDNVNDAGGSVALDAIIAAVHDFGLLLTATRAGDTVADEISFADGKWYRRVGRTKPAWTTTANEGEGSIDSYTHTAVIADMKAGGIAECGSLNLEVNANAVSYTDSLPDATSDYVKYELATVAQGNVSAAHLAIEDWGLELLTEASGQAEVTMQYAQGYPDAVANLVNGGYQRRTEELEAQIATLRSIVDDIGSSAEGYVRVAGSSNPALSYAHYSYGKPGGFTRDSVFGMLYPCLVGTPLTGSGTEGKVLHVLKKLGARTATEADVAANDALTVGQAVWDDTDGTPHAIDGSEGDVMIANVGTYHRIMGRRTIDGVEYDVFLVAPAPFTWQGIASEEVAKGGVSPDYTVSHADTDSVTRMHSVFNPAWDGSYSEPVGVAGAYVFAQDAGGNITESYDAEATLLGGAGGLHTTNLSLPAGEQRAMNNNADTTKTYPWMNSTAASVEDWYALMLAEGGTFDAHKAALMGSGFCANDPATTAADWEESAAPAKNGIRIEDKNGVMRMYALSSDTKAWSGGSESLYAGELVNSWRNPWHVMEAHRALCYAMQHGIGELQWFVMDGVKYKWRSIDGFAGPADGEMTAVVWKQMSARMTARFVDPTDMETSLEGHRIDFLFSTALYHGITTQVSPSVWTSGMVMVQDEDGNYDAYMQRDQTRLIVTPTGEVSADARFAFEDGYTHVATYAGGTGYAKNYSNLALMLPDTDANKAGAGLHTYVCKYNNFSATKPAAGKRAVRGFRRGSYAYNTNLSPLCVYGYSAPSGTASGIAFGTCVRIAE